MKFLLCTTADHDETMFGVAQLQNVYPDPDDDEKTMLYFADGVTARIWAPFWAVYNALVSAEPVVDLRQDDKASS